MKENGDITASMIRLWMTTFRQEVMMPNQWADPIPQGPQVKVCYTGALSSNAHVQDSAADPPLHTWHFSSVGPAAFILLSCCMWLLVHQTPPTASPPLQSLSHLHCGPPPPCSHLQR